MTYENALLMRLIVITVLFFALQHECRACSMYKVTREGKTVVGCNEDAWRTTSRIWFENAKTENGYGAAFTGSRQVGKDRFAPQSGMNEAGLVFSRLASYFPLQELNDKAKKAVGDEVAFLKDILHTCATVADVKKYLEQYDHSIFIDDVFIYVDRSGKYLVVEPYTVIEGSDPSYVLSNFCPSITRPEDAMKLERYRNGDAFLRTNGRGTSLAFFTALSDTMHVCRSRNGDGTLLTSIWDTQNGRVNLYFYHDFDTTVQFSLAEELSKGDKMLDVAGLFPPNPEFERLANYMTPFNTPELRVALVIVGGILMLISFLFLLHMLRGNTAFTRIAALFSLQNLFLTAYLFVLATNINVYYFDAPYKHHSSALITYASYIPFLLLLTFIPLAYVAIRFIKTETATKYIDGTLVLNSLIYIASTGAFAYWGLFSVF